MTNDIQRDLSKLLREQQDAIDNHSDSLVIERNNEEIWALRNKYACGSTWGKDPAFDKWWVKQVAKARNLNIARQIFMWIAIGAVAIFILVSAERDKQADEWAKKHLSPEELQDYYDSQPDYSN